jgi:hypothetical protein
LKVHVLWKGNHLTLPIGPLVRGLVGSFFILAHIDKRQGCL